MRKDNNNEVLLFSCVLTRQVVCHSAPVAKELGQRLNRSCRGSSREFGSWLPNVSYELWSDEGGCDCDCSRGLNFAMHELQLLRLEKQHLHHHLEQLVEELYLGDIHTEPAQRMYYRPSSYQAALQNARVRIMYSTSSSCFL